MKLLLFVHMRSELLNIADQPPGFKNGSQRLFIILDIFQLVDKVAEYLKITIQSMYVQILIFKEVNISLNEKLEHAAMRYTWNFKISNTNYKSAK